MTSEQDQVFGANPKIGLRKKECFCRALTWHILSQDFKRVSLRLQPPIPKAEYFSLGQFSKLTLAALREKLGSPASDHTLVSKKGVMNNNSNKNFATTKKKNTYYKTAHINLRARKWLG